MLLDLNARMSAKIIKGMVGEYGVPGRNESGERS